MKPRTWIALLAVVVMASVCVRLGFWQLARWREKQALNARQRAALAEAPLRAPWPRSQEVAGRVVEVRGRFDETRQVLLSGRARKGAPGVEVVTPLLMGDGAPAVLIDRGWLYSADAATARPQDYREPGLRVVRGLAEPLTSGAGRRSRADTALRELRAQGISLYSARRLDAHALEQRWPYVLSPFMIRQLPGPGVPAQPARAEPRRYDETMHLSYAVQWFLFAAILTGGSAVLAWTRRRRS
jgi:surfeit locus 1 family protein